jgi:hypothetical protein
MINLLIINVSGNNPEMVLFPDYEISKFPHIYNVVTRMYPAGID